MKALLIGIVVLSACGTRAEGDHAQPPVAPVPVAPAPAPVAPGPVVAEIGLGDGNQCIRTTDDVVRCTGDWPLEYRTPTSSGGTNQDLEKLIAVTHLGPIRGMSLVQNRGCAALVDGSVRCWGNTNGTADGWTGAVARVFDAVAVAGVSSAIAVALTLGEGCAVTADHGIVCWGPDLVAPAGRNNAAAPAARKVDIGAKVTQISGGWNHFCAVTEAGGVVCWGDGGNGELDGKPASRGVARTVAVPGVDHVVEVRASRDHTCARTAGGGVWCWGANGDAQLGDGTTDPRTAPVRVAGIDDAAAIALSSSLSCALSRTGKVQCWGEESNCDLGDGAKAGCLTRTMGATTGPVDLRFCPTAQPITIHVHATHLVVGSTTGCAWDDAGRAECWGLSHLGEPPSCVGRALAPP